MSNTCLLPLCSADFQSAVSQTSSLRACGQTRPPQPICVPADWKSAIQQTGSLRYSKHQVQHGRGGLVCGPTNGLK
jgi:hypothetical protein